MCLSRCASVGCTAHELAAWLEAEETALVTLPDCANKFLAENHKTFLKGGT